MVDDVELCLSGCQTRRICGKTDLYTRWIVILKKIDNVGSETKITLLIFVSGRMGSLEVMKVDF